MSSGSRGSGLEFAMLGPLQVRRDGGGLALGGRQQRAVLAFLLTEPDTTISVETLADALWGDAPPRGHVTTVQTYVFHLRQVLEPGRARGSRGNLLVSGPGGYRLELDGCGTDVGGFEALLTRGQGALATGAWGEAAAALQRALGQWRGPVLADLADFPFVAPVAARLDELRLSAHESLAEADISLGRHAKAVADLDRLIAEHPLRERLHAQRMLALYRCGRQSESLAAYRELRGLLSEEMGIEPSPEIQQLHQSILAQDPALAWQPTGPPSLDLEEADHPALGPSRPPTNVRQRTLVGRHEEREHLRELVLRSDVRLVTVTGAGGVGKTTLVEAVALDVLELFPQGAHFVDLTRVTGVDDVLPSVASVRETPLGGEEPVERSIARHIGDKRMLLVLDNFEQVLGAAPAVAGLLERCPRLSVVVTSRFALGVRDEHRYTLPPMGLPDGPSLEQVADSDAVQLFMERARRFRQDFALTTENAAAVGEVCRLLDGLPLAIELAAARTRLFSPGALVDRLSDRLALLTHGSRDAPERHRTLRTTIDWTYGLLTAKEQRFFCDLAVFTGGARLESIAAVVTDGEEALDLTTALVDHNLVVQREDLDGEPRIGMLQTIREYAVGKLRQDPTHFVDLRERHARHYLTVVEGTLLPGTYLLTEPVRRDHDNVHDALAFWLDERCADDPEAGVKALRLAAALGYYWFQLDHDGLPWLERAIAAAPHPPDGTRALALFAMGAVRERRSEFDLAEEALDQARSLYQQLGDRIGETHCLNRLGTAANDSGRFTDAQQLFEAAVALCEATGDPARDKFRENLGQVHMHQGDWTRARDILTESLARARVTKDDLAVTNVSRNLAQAHLIGGEAKIAARFIGQAMAGFATLGATEGPVGCLLLSVGVAVAAGKWTAAARLAGTVDTAHHTSSLPLIEMPERTLLEEWREQTRSHIAGKAYGDAWEAGAATTLEEATSFALTEVIGPSSEAG